MVQLRITWLHTRFSYLSDPSHDYTLPSLLLFSNTIIILVSFTSTTVFKCYYAFILLGFKLQVVLSLSDSHCCWAWWVTQSLYNRDAHRCSLWWPRPPVVIVNGSINFRDTDTHSERALCLEICF